MNVTVRKSNICGRVKIPPSKSVAHRMMIAAALSGRALRVENGGKDIAATANCLEIMSSAIGELDRGIYDTKTSVVDDGKCKTNYAVDGKSHAQNIHNCSSEDGVLLNAGESGSTLRFLLPVICALGIECTVTGEGRLKDRPLRGLIDALIKNGACIERIGEEQLPLRVSGRLTAGTYRIDGGVSSQYVTGLLFALPLLDGDSTIEIDGELVSANYVDITLGVLADFGIEIKKIQNGFFVRGNQKYTAPENMEVEGDWSSAAFMLAAGILAGEARISGLNAYSKQGDKVVVDLLRSAGADIEVKEDLVIARKSRLHAIDFDCKHCPDAVPVMAAVLSFADGVSHISSVDRLRDKESDRLAAVMSMLADFGIATEYSYDVLTVYGGEHKACATHGFCDHRMAMSAIVTALNTEGESSVGGVECIDKSYPAFLAHIKAMGADIRTE